VEGREWVSPVALPSRLAVTSASDSAEGVTEMSALESAEDPSPAAEMSVSESVEKPWPQAEVAALVWTP
jgi:hypothetical protein